MSSWKNSKIEEEAKALESWFQENSRPLPWRKSQNPYRIWVSEVMLQQTTVKAVIPYYKRFMKRFPTLKSLAEARIEDIYEMWAGLGYYSRARNLHKAAQEIHQLKKFPKNHTELLKLSGFGDYTARAVASQAYLEPVGVVDGNVIRVLCRRYGLAVEHWKNKEKKALQELADQYATLGCPSSINQGFMELGATICIPHNPTCLLCPLKKNCVALKEDRISELPLKKPKREMEIWQWNVDLIEDRGRIAFITNEYAPFLKKQLILPGKAQKKKVAPKNFDFQHGITHHKIYVKISRKRSNFDPAKIADIQWISRKQLKEKVPFALVQKAVQMGLGDNF
jgi:A/G-specific adenine glycosylase